jgi:hypothetical protein
MKNVKKFLKLEKLLIQFLFLNGKERNGVLGKHFLKWKCY